MHDYMIDPIARPDYSYPDKPADNGMLSYSFYDKSCPNLSMIVSATVKLGVSNGPANPDRSLALHGLEPAPDRVLWRNCHNGCDASVLLDDTKDFKGEKNASPNRNSARGFEVIESIKADVEKSCPSTVSCADILVLAAREAVVMSGGPNWPIPLGRRDGITASEKAANEQLPSPFEPLQNITAKFVANGLDVKDMVVLSGGHTIGFAQCSSFKRRLFNFKDTGKPDPTLDSSVLSNLQNFCPNIDGSNNKTSPLDSQSVYRFDNIYYKNIINNSGLLESDQALIGDPKTEAMVKDYSADQFLFSRDFAASMVKLGNIGVLTGQAGQIRNKCGSIN
ncbi:Peroxidase 10 [Abeliophyllum distichum]|uniref:Peroxidase n=1 Tax=Abeliophyllum distichum TaxID=126358 RepID=A0ABD1THJ1_9LAMI